MMALYRLCFKHISFAVFLVIVFTLSGCELLESGNDDDEDLGDTDDTEFVFEDELGEEGGGAAGGGPLLFLAPRSVASMPWFFAAQENVLNQYNEEYGVSIEFQEASRRDSLDRFVDGEADAIMATNIDVVSRVIGQSIEADVILVCGYSQGDNVILVGTGDSVNLLGKKVAVEQFSADHFLLDRFLLKNLIDFDAVEISDIQSAEAIDALSSGNSDAVVTSNPEAALLVSEQNAQVVFDSHEIPREITYLLVLRRSRIDDRPATQALYATWINVMERLLGNQREATLDALAEMNGMGRNEYERQFNTVLFNDTESKILSTLRDRKVHKTMRHVRFFMQRHQLVPGDAMVANWYSLPGRAPATLHFNAAPMEHFIAP